jgi:transcriptional regulator with XRE-family HTH domain
MKTPSAPPRPRREPVKQHHPFVLALGEVLREAQQRRPVSDTKLAAAAGVATATVGNLKRGFCDSKASTLWHLCRALREDIVRVVRRAKALTARRLRAKAARLTH